MKFFNKIIASGMLLASVSVFADLPQPYVAIHNLPATPYYVQDAYIYYNLVNSNSAHVVVDVGSQDGGVARYLAQAANSLTSVNLIYEVNSFPESVSEPHAFQLFLSNVKQENTAGLIVPVRMNSHQAASALNVVADFIKIEATSDNIYSDILAWYPHLSQTGILAGNNWNDSSVALGVMQAAESLDLSVNINASVWYFVKNAP